MQPGAKSLVFAFLIVVLLGGSWLVFRSTGPADFGVRVIGRTNNPAGRLQIIYEITNRTSKDVIFALASVETATGTGWHVETRKQWGEQRELRATRMLGRRSASDVRIIAGAGDTTVRGRVEYEKEDSPLAAKTRKLARRMGLPRGLWAPQHSILGVHPSVLIRLPEVETRGPPFLLATTAAGVWPEPAFERAHRHNGYMRGWPSQILDHYREFSGVAVRVDPSVPLYSSDITVNPDHDLSGVSEVTRAIEDALREQAGIVVAQRASNSVTFTWHEKGKVNTR